MAILEPKISTEVRDYLFNWEPFLGTDNIATSTVTVVGATLNSTSNTPKTVNFWVSGGVNGTVATITNAITTTGGRTETEVHTILIRETPEPLSLADAKAQVRVISDDQDAYIAGLIPAARRYVENRSGIILKRRQFIERVYPRYGAMTLLHGPLVSIDSVSYPYSSSVTDSYAGARFFPGSSIIFPALGESWPTPYSGEQFQVTYTAGLSQAQLVTENYDGLVHAMKLLVGHWFANREAVAGPEGSRGQVPLGVNSLCDQERIIII